MGLRPVPVEWWLEPADPDELGAKIVVLDAHPEVLGWLPGSEAAQAELAGVLGLTG